MRTSSTLLGALIDRKLQVFLFVGTVGPFLTG